MIEPFVRLLSQLPIRGCAGAFNMPLTGGGVLRGEMRVDAGSARLTLRDEVGSLDIGSERVWYESRAGASAVSLPEGVLTGVLRQGLPLDYDGIRRVLRALPPTTKQIDEAVGRFDSLAVDSVSLVFPGIVAFRARIGPIPLGPLVLPEITSDVALRDLAFDLRSGSVSCELLLQNARAHGAVSFVADGISLEATDARLSIRASLSIGLDGNIGEIQLQLVDVWAPQTKVALASGGTRVDAQVADLALALRGILARKEPAGPWSVHSGAIEVDCASGTFSATNLSMDQHVSVSQLTAKLAGLSLSGWFVENAVRGRVTLKRSEVTANDVAFVDLPAGFRTLTLETPVEALSQDLVLDVETMGPVDGFVGLVAGVRAADVSIGGLDLTATTTNNRVRVNGQTANGDQRVAIQIAFPEVTLAWTDGHATVRDVQLAYWRNELASAVIGADRDKFVSYTAHGVTVLSFLVPPFTIATLKGGWVQVSFMNPTRTLTDALLPLLESAGVDTGHIRRALDAVGSFLANPAKWAADFFSIITFDKFGVDDFGVLVGVKDTVISFNPGASGDNIIAFRLVTGLNGLKAYIVYHYWDPELDDWGHTSQDRQETNPIGFDIELDFILEVQIFVDLAARRIAVQDVNFYPDTVLPDQVDRALAKIASTYFGVESVKKAIVDAIALRIPLGLPLAWDATRVTVSKTDGAISIDVRAVEHDFNPL